MLKLLIGLGIILFVWCLVGYLIFFFYIKKGFIEQLLSSGMKKKKARHVWRQSKRVLLRMSWKILFRGE